MKLQALILAIPVGIFVFACRKESTSPATSGVQILNLPAHTAEYYSVWNSINDKATLGRVLFYDGHLSVNNSISCGSCHKQAFGFSDNVALSTGYEGRLTKRNSPSIQNLLIQGLLRNNNDDITFGTGSLLFWDGRENNLQNLVLRPVSNHAEMGMEDFTRLPAKIKALPYYDSLFTKAYGTSDITLDRITHSIALFISAINTGGSRFELYGNGQSKLTAQELYGAQLFNTKYNCVSCHNLQDNSGYFTENFIDNGLDKNPTDLGEGAITSNPFDNGKFKAPKLHNVAVTGPYMHDGRFKTFDEVLEFYSQGINASPNLDFRLRDRYNNPVRLNISSDEKAALIAFLNTLTDYNMLTDAKFSNPFLKQ